MTRSSRSAMWQYSIGPRTRKYVKGHGFLSAARKCKKLLLDRRLDAVKTASIKAVYKAGEFLGNKIADALTKSKDDKIVKPDENLKHFEETIISLEKRDKILNKLGKVW